MRTRPLDRWEFAAVMFVVFVSVFAFSLWLLERPAG